MTTSKEHVVCNYMGEPVADIWAALNEITECLERRDPADYEDVLCEARDLFRRAAHLDVDEDVAAYAVRRFLKALYDQLLAQGDRHT